MTPERPSEFDLGSPHNALMLVLQMYGQILQEQQRRFDMLKAIHERTVAEYKQALQTIDKLKRNGQKDASGLSGNEREGEASQQG